MRCFFRFFLLVILALPVAAKPSSAKTKSVLTINIAYLVQEQSRPKTLSNLEPYVADKGEPGAELAIEDNNTTGKFTKQKFTLKKIIVPASGDQGGGKKDNPGKRKLELKRLWNRISPLIDNNSWLDVPPCIWEFKAAQSSAKANHISDSCRCAGF